MLPKMPKWAKAEDESKAEELLATWSRLTTETAALGREIAEFMLAHNCQHEAGRALLANSADELGDALHHGFRRMVERQFSGRPAQPPSESQPGTAPQEA